ncbi:MAG: regulatory protein RecX [Egibacteraceae bacterium]
MDPVGETLAFILRSTAARPQTEAEIVGRLRSRQVPGDVAETALTQAKSLRAIDDAAFARAWVCDRGTRRGYGVTRLRQELRRRLVPEDLIEEALTQLEDRDDLAIATELARQWASRLPSTLSREASARRIGGYLTRRGYPLGLAERVAWTVSGASSCAGSGTHASRIQHTHRPEHSMRIDGEALDGATAETPDAGCDGEAAYGEKEAAGGGDEPRRGPVENAGG